MIETCIRNMRPGWRCTRRIFHDGPCALVPKWWNLKARWQYRA